MKDEFYTFMISEILLIIICKRLSLQISICNIFLVIRYFLLPFNELWSIGETLSSKNKVKP